MKKPVRPAASKPAIPRDQNPIIQDGATTHPACLAALMDTLVAAMLDPETGPTFAKYFVLAAGPIVSGETPRFLAKHSRADQADARKMLAGIAAQMLKTSKRGSAPTS